MNSYQRRLSYPSEAVKCFSLVSKQYIVLKSFKVPIENVLFSFDIRLYVMKTRQLETNFSAVNYRSHNEKKEIR